jgi:hypothetical protein
MRTPLGARVVGDDVGSGGAQVRGERQGGGFADVVRVGLEREPQLGDPPPRERPRAAEQGLEPSHDLALMDRVRAMDRRHERRLDVQRRGLEGDGDRLLGQAGAADAGAGLEERGADPRIQADPRDDRLDVGPGGVGDPGHLVGE